MLADEILERGDKMMYEQKQSKRASRDALSAPKAE
jgi:hypothetical protein